MILIVENEKDGIYKAERICRYNVFKSNEKMLIAVDIDGDFKTYSYTLDSFDRIKVVTESGFVLFSYTRGYIDTCV